ncbi:DUF2628 domain-containing protein [Stenotrophomonas sp. CFBP8980]|jgi:hypothetical protein|uniref:DUF2628 domain-containing protein n=1 Tax=Stenotrophomonas sp. CFBP8980 TaxID=3096523 RepID=UPI002A69CE33|nr:DUF2628 domain-containing protein [Stenotrophomonas sp. CFBP8980]MDY1032039.1 DUF2628 domain-containing protein [Stenotrophomonas sp. CFBP8980]
METPNTVPHSPKWQYRFDFFAQHGAPKTKEYRQALKDLPFAGKLRVNINLFALFFSWIYLFILGMWRKGLVVFGLYVALITVSFFVPDLLVRALVAALGLSVAMSTNYSYYAERVKGKVSWNPFEGLF